MPSPTGRRLALLGGTIATTFFLAVGAAVGAVPRIGDAPAQPAAATDSPAVQAQAPAPAPVAEAAPATTEAPPTTVAPEPSTTVAPATATKPAAPKTPPTTAAPAPAAPAPAAPTTPPATTAPKVAPGQRITPTSAQVQAAITALHSRIPMFSPTESQLLAFADAACSQFDQGQTFAQVQATVQKAVSYVQGASLSAADAQYAVNVVVSLRCPGYLA